MTDAIKDGGPAFPSEGEGHNNPKYHSPGMTLRDWFAGQALSALMESEADDCALSAKELPDLSREFAKQAYAIADAMIEFREVKS